MAEPTQSASPAAGAAGGRPPISVIVHGHRWPAAAIVAALRARLLEALPDAEIIEAREDAASAVGASALMSVAATRATGGVLLFLEPSVLPSVEELRALTEAAAASQGLALVGGWRRGWDSNPRAGYPTSRFQGAPVTTSSVPRRPDEFSSKAIGGGTDLLSRLAAEFAHLTQTLSLGEMTSVPSEWARPFPTASFEDRGDSGRRRASAGEATQDAATPIVAVSRVAYDAVGGLDVRLWSVGIADDLIARAAIAGVTVRHLDITPERVAPPAYPLRTEVARLLAIRNALLIAFKTAPADALGETIARLAIDALMTSWRATGLSTDAFAFGGGWGRNAGALGTLRQRLTGRSGLEAPLANPDGCLLPLLAIDSALDELSIASATASPAIDERNAWQRMARASHALAAAEPQLKGSSSEGTAGASSSARAHNSAIDGAIAAAEPRLKGSGVVAASSATHGHDAAVDGALAAAQPRLKESGPVAASLPSRGHDAAVDGALAAAEPRLKGSGAVAASSPTHGHDAAIDGTVAAAEPRSAGPVSLSRASASGDAVPAKTLPDAPTVSVVVVNWNGKEHLQDCFGSLQRSDYPADKLGLICVDNGSKDGSVDFLRAEFPRVKVIALDHNRGFTGGNEAGVREATGDVLVFLNNDMRVEPDCLRELVGALDADCSCAGARVLSWDGRAIDFIRGSLNFEGRGFQDSYGLPNLPELATPAETFFPNGGAFAVTRDAYDRAGGFDPAFFAYYDDIDLGWRLRLTGTSIRVVGRAVVYHRHGATSRTQPHGQKRFLMDRNALWTLMKSYGELALGRTLGPALVLAIRRVLDESTLDPRAPLARSVAPFVVRCRKSNAAPVWPAAAVYAEDDASAGDGPMRATGSHAVAGGAATNASRAAARNAATEASASGPTSRTPTPGAAPLVRSMPLEALGALCAAVEALPSLAAVRADVQARRAVDDRAILPRFGRALAVVSPFSSYRRIQQALMEAEELSEVFRARTRLLIIGHEALARHMSGPAVRVFEMGKALSSVARVTIATPGVTEVDDSRCTFATYDPAEPSGLKRLAEDADAIVVQGFTLVKFPFLKTMHVPIVVDLYCPFTLEHLEQTRTRLAAGADPQGERLAAVQRDAAGVLGVQNEQLIDGDFFICASEAQRDFWIGTLHTQGRVNPLTYGDDPTLRRLIDVVPFGLSEMPIEEAATRAAAAAGATAAASSTASSTIQRDANGHTHVMKGVWPGIGVHDRVLLWAGSLLDWQDPLTLIRAVAQLSRTRSDVKLVFMGTRHPNPLVSPMRVVEESRTLAAQLGVLDTHVFFNDWVPYEQRALFLRDADLGLSTHREHLETHFSFRTRMLDYLWAGLPIVCTRGDHFAALVDERRLGAVVAPGDVTALAEAIDGLLDDSAEGRARRDAVQANIANIREEMRWTRVVSPLAKYCAQPYLAADHAPALREFRERLAQQYGGAKWVKRTVLRLGLSEYQFERMKSSKLGRAAMSLQTRRAIQRAKRQS